MERPPLRLSTRRRLLWLILVSAFLVRLAWGVSRPADDAAIAALPDQREYLSLARHLLGRDPSASVNDRFWFYDPRFADTLYAYRMPGYPAFLALAGANVRIARIAQAAVETSAVLAVYLLARALLRTPAHLGLGPLFAAALVALNPYLIYFSALLLSETLFAAMLAWGMLLLVCGQRGARLRWSADPQDDPRPPRPGRGTLLWLGGGVLLVLSGLVRPPGIPLAIMLALATVILNRPGPDSYEGYSQGHGRGRGSLRIRWPLPVGTTMLLLTVAVLMPWAWRNHRVLGTWLWTTTNSGVTAFDGFNPDATGASNQSALAGMLPHLRTLNEVQRSEYLGGLAWEFVREQPRRTMELAVIKAGRTWSPIPLSVEFASRRNQLIGLSYAVPFDLLVLAGLLSGGLGRGTKVFLLLPAIYLTAVHMLSVGSLRYRMPVEPLLAVVAAAAIAKSGEGWRRSRVTE